MNNLEPGAATLPWTQTFYWSIRRELWENRFLYIAPSVAAVLMLVGFLFSLRHFAHMVNALTNFDKREQIAELVMTFSHATWLIMLTALIVGMVYCFGALHNERSDRSILFWKSLPVADLVTVLAKASIPLLILPAIVVVVALCLQLILLLFGTAALAPSGGASILWRIPPWWQLEMVYGYELIVLVLWMSPIYAWFLLVSGWARRTVFLWAVLPPVALGLLEKITFGTTTVWSLIRERMIGFLPRAFDLMTPDGGPSDPHLVLWSQITPGRFLATPGLWLGLMVAAALIFAAVRQRRFREPI